MQLALDDAGLTRPTSGTSNAHGTSTPLNDAAEAEALRKVFGDDAAARHVVQGRPRAHDRWRGRGRGRRSRCCRSRDGVVPPTANLERIGDDIGLDVVAGEARRDRIATCALELVRVRRSQRDLGADRDRERLTDVAAPTPLVGHRSATVTARLRETRRPHRQLVPHRGRQARRRDRPSRGPGDASGRSASPSSSASRSSGLIASSGADVAEGVASLHAWGRVAHALSPTRPASSRRCSP